jgi:hypothetical protein
VLRDLQQALNVDITLAVTVKDTYTRLPLTALQRREAVDSMLSALGSVPAADVHEIVLYVLRDACPGDHLTAVVQVRLHVAWPMTSCSLLSSLLKCGSGVWWGQCVVRSV